MTPNEFNTRLASLIEEAKQAFDPEWVFLGVLVCKATDELYLHGVNRETFANTDAVLGALRRVTDKQYFDMSTVRDMAQEGGENK